MPTIPSARVNSFGVPGPRGPAGEQGPTGPAGADGTMPNTANIADFGAVPGGNASTGVRTANTLAIQAAIDSLLGDQSQSSIEGRGGEVLIPPGVWEINDVVGIDVSLDFVANLTVRGIGGRYACVLRQADTTKTCFQVKGSTQNVRGVTLRDFTIRGGSIGLELTNDNYNYFDNMVFYQQSTYAIKATVLGGFGSYFNGCLVQHLNGNAVKLVSGKLWFGGCVFGEDGGAFEVGGGRLQMDNCLVFDSADQLSLTDVGQGNSLFYCTNGSTLQINGGLYQPGDSCDTFLYCTHARDMLIDGCDVLMHSTMGNFIYDYEASNGPKPFAILHAKPLRIQAKNPSGVVIYQEKSHLVAKCHRNAVIDTIVEYITVAPSVDAAFSDVSNSNTATLRARVDNSL